MAGRVLAIRVFFDWYDQLDAFRTGLVNLAVHRLRADPYNLPHPYSSGTNVPRIRELRILNVHHPIRVFYALDRERDVVLLAAGDKKGAHDQSKWTMAMAQRAERLFIEHLMDPRFAIDFVERAVPRLAETAEALEKLTGKPAEASLQPGGIEKGMHAPAEEILRAVRRELPPIPEPTIEALMRATGWSRSDIVELAQPGGALDPMRFDSGRRIEAILSRARPRGERVFVYHGNVRFFIRRAPGRGHFLVRVEAPHRRPKTFVVAARTLREAYRAARSQLGLEGLASG